MLSRRALALTLLLASAAAVAAKGHKACPDDYLSGGNSAFHLICNSKGGGPACVTKSGHGSKGYEFVKVDEVLKYINGLDGKIFFKKAGSCKVDKAYLLRVCTNGSGASDYHVKIMLVSKKCGQMRVKAHCDKHGSKYDCSLNGRTAS